MPTDLLAMAEVARDFLAKSGYLFAQLEKSEFDAEKKQWVLIFNVAISEKRLKKVVIDESTAKVIAFE